MSVLLYIEKSDSPDWAAASQRARTEALKASTKAMAEEWKDKYLPRHFEPGNAARYGHQPRKPKYLAQKARAGSREKNKYGRSNASFSKVAGGGLLDLVFRGNLRRDIKSKSTVRGFPTRATVYLRGPEYFTTRPRDLTKPNLAREILTIIPSERAELRATGSKAFFEVLNKPRRRGRPRRIGA